MRQAIKNWLPFATIILFLAGTIYMVAHSLLRQTANDPQIQLAEDWANTVTSGTDPARLSLGPFIDPAHSLSPFGIVYDQDGNIVASSVSAPTTMKQPDGVFDSIDTAKDNEARFTWQPASGERYATVIKKAIFQDKPYYILAGRNLRTTEDRLAMVLKLTIIGAAITLVAVAVMQHMHLVTQRIRRR